MTDARTWILQACDGTPILPLVRRVETDRFPELGFLAALNGHPPMPIVFIGEWELCLEGYRVGRPMPALAYPSIEIIQADGWEID